MPKTKEKLNDYYARVTVEVVVYLQAEDENSAEKKIDEIADNFVFNTSNLSKVEYDSIDLDGHKVGSIHLDE